MPAILRVRLRVKMGRAGLCLYPDRWSYRWHTDDADSAHTFVLGVDGRAVAHTHGHGRTLHWF